MDLLFIAPNICLFDSGVRSEQVTKAFEFAIDALEKVIHDKHRLDTNSNCILLRNIDAKAIVAKYQIHRSNATSLPAIFNGVIVERITKGELDAVLGSTSRVFAACTHFLDC